MKKLLKTFLLFVVVYSLIVDSDTFLAYAESGAQEQVDEPEKGPHGGRLMKDGNFVLELSIFETGVPPEFRVWVTNEGEPVEKVGEVDLEIVLSRLGGKEDRIQFNPQGDFLRGDSPIYEPHSFVVNIAAKYQGKAHQWKYDNFEGRTSIAEEVAKALEIETSVAGPKVLKETIDMFGKVITNPEFTRNIRARFEGTVREVHVSVGQIVKKGQPLLTVDSNESLKPYTLASPIDGVIRQREVNPGEQTAGQILIVVTDSSHVMGEFAVFPMDRQRVSIGAKIFVSTNGSGSPIEGTIHQIDDSARANQSTVVRVLLEDKQNQLVPGSFATAKIEVAEHPVSLAVERRGLQAFRDFTVVYAKIGDEYEVRMLELGRVAGDWVEVLGGLEPGTSYVTKNSFIIKADIEKSGASHDH